MMGTTYLLTAQLRISGKEYLTHR